MAGFLRKKATTEKKHAGVDAKQAQLPQLPPKLPEVPPSLPPLFARFASKAPEESESPYNPWTTEISPPMLLNNMSQGPEVPQTSADEPPDVWDEWGIFEKNISTGMVMSDQTFADPRTQGTTGFSNYSSQGALPQPRQKAAIPASVPVNPRLHSFYEKSLPNGPHGILTRSPDIPSNNIHTDTSPSNGISSRSPEQKSSRPVREEIPSPPTVPSKTTNARDVETSQRSSKPSLPVHHSPISPLQTKSPKPTAPVPVLPGPTYSASSPSANHIPSSSPTAARRQLPSPAPSQDLGHTPRPPEKHSDRFPAQNTRHQAHPGSNSSHMSSTAYTSSNYTDMTGKTRSTLYSAHTSASLIAASKVKHRIIHGSLDSVSILLSFTPLLLLRLHPPSASIIARECLSAVYMLFARRGVLTHLGTLLDRSVSLDSFEICYLSSGSALLASKCR
ncbi:hypothetical protein BJ138DRAFT_499481 [Hygrophoropsis aurantiaca]|uniref:Uncharacterized protein n=1 Tax=Hygrophoropsis aurantiaca TaxID=72124 RepID=A0ACB8A376_9AGAM|nr:hypothetical protein BJ138DRAFT_499481 [Hygrophoropsis aurantiaca]